LHFADLTIFGFRVLYAFFKLTLSEILLFITTRTEKVMAIIVETKPAVKKGAAAASVNADADSSAAPHLDCSATEGRIEHILLDWEDRRKPRQRVVTDQGTEVVLALPRGTVLAHGDCLYQDKALTIKVQAKAQSVLTIFPINAVETCRVAHHLGNWHRSIEVLADGTLKTQCDEPFQEWLKREGIKHEKVEAPFHPNCSGTEH
jgi:urease accessory protein